jgi:hypothetical protein
MIRRQLVLGRTSQRKASACRRSLGAAALLLCALLAAGCGEDNQRVPEDFPSGARPAPVDAAALAAATHQAVELPPPPPAEPTVEPAGEPPLGQAPGKPVAVAARPGSE